MMEESSVSTKGRLVAEFLNHFTHDMSLGHMVVTGEIRRRIPEPEWKVPELFTMETIELPDFSMRLLSLKEGINRKHVILQLHGGGYVGAVRNKYYVFAGLYNEVSKGCSVLTPDYRVAPENPYPAALLDAVSSYKWLLMQGYTGRQIILAGDSAGGGLAMALTLYLKDHKLPMPGGLILMSPWTDLTLSGESYIINFDKDPMFGNTRDSMLYNNPYPGGVDPKAPYISPLFGDYTGFPPMLFQVGSLEMLKSDTLEAAAKAKACGVKVRASVYEGMFHVFQMAYLALPESRKAWEEVGSFFAAISADEVKEDVKR